jgi:hypothetical protein
MSSHTDRQTHTDDHYRAFLEDQELTTLRDWALHLARERRDVGFLWGLAKHLPDTEAANTDWAAYDPIDAVRELVHLFTHFRQEAASDEIGAMLRARYLDYLLDHAGQHRFDR